MCIWFGYNPQINFFHIVTYITFDLVIFGGFLIGGGHKLSDFACCLQNSKKGKHCFEVRMTDKTYLLAAETDAEMEDWIKVLDKVRTAAETLSQISLERPRGMLFFDNDKCLALCHQMSR